MQTCEGLILKRALWGENDHRLWVLDETGAIIEVIAKNTGTANSKRRAHLEPITHVKLNLHYGKTHAYLREIVSLNSFIELKNHWESLMRAELLIEIMLDIMKQNNENDPQVYTICTETFQKLQAEPNGLGLEWGLVQLANQWGQLPNFKECTQCFLPMTCETCTECDWNPHPEIPFPYRKAIEFLKTGGGRNRIGNFKLSNEERVTLNGILLNAFSAYWSRPPRSLAWLNLYEPSAPQRNVPATSA